MTQETQTIHVREVEVGAWGKARAGAMLAGVTVGKWLTRAIENLYGAQQEGKQRIENLAKLAEQTVEVSLPPGTDPETVEVLPAWLDPAVPFVPERTLGPEDESLREGGVCGGCGKTYYLREGDERRRDADGRLHQLHDVIKPAKAAVAVDKIPGVTRGKEPLWKNKKKKQLV
jgi:hypothetical protein